MKIGPGTRKRPPVIDVAYAKALIAWNAKDATTRGPRPVDPNSTRRRPKTAAQQPSGAPRAEYGGRR